MRIFIVCCCILPTSVSAPRFTRSTKLDTQALKNNIQSDCFVHHITHKQYTIRLFCTPYHTQTIYNPTVLYTISHTNNIQSDCFVHHITHKQNGMMMVTTGEVQFSHDTKFHTAYATHSLLLRRTN